MRALAGLAFGLCVWAGALLAQDATQVPVAPNVTQAAILVIDRNRVYVESRYGQRLITEFNARATEVQAENDRIVADLIAEERSLTQQRPTMTAEAFRAAADAFDSKAQETRRARDAEKETLLADLAAREAGFFERIDPIIAWVMEQRGASLVLDKNADIILFQAEGVDVTQVLIDLVNSSLGDGTQNGPVRLPRP